MAEQGEIVMCTLDGSGDGQSVTNNVFTWIVTAGNPDDEDILQAITSWIVDEWVGNLLEVTDAQYVYDDIVVNVMNEDGTVKRLIGFFGVNQSGQAVGHPVAAATSGWITAGTKVPKTRGSKYIPGLAQSDLISGEWGNLIQAALAQVLLAYLLDIDLPTAGVLTPGVLSRTTQLFQNFTTSGDIETVPAYQRRRKPGVGS